jgi:hypothetical protein
MKRFGSEIGTFFSDFPRLQREYIMLDLPGDCIYLPSINFRDLLSEEFFYLVNRRPQGVVKVLGRRIRGAPTSTTSWRRRFSR